MWSLARMCPLQQDTLMRVLPGRVVISSRETFQTWDRYLLAFCDRGGVIEACPRMVTGSPSANVFIDPAGRLRGPQLRILPPPAVLLQRADTPGALQATAPCCPRRSRYSAPRTAT